MPFWKKSKGSGGGGRRLRILFVTDLHGSEYTFRKFLKALEIWKPDVFIGGGDVAGKGLLPILDSGNGTVRMRFMGEERDIPRDQLPEARQRADQLGFYPYVADADGLQRLQNDEAESERVFDELMQERWRDWLERLDARCGELQVPAFVIAGNDDPWSLDAISEEQREWVTAADGKVLPLADDYLLVSCGLANPTPWGCPRDVPESDLAERLDALAEEVDDFSRVVANIHVPPHDSALDVAAALDTSVDPPQAIAGETMSVGSTAVAEWLRARQPLLSLHGHIHESPGAVNLGRTRAINPGSEYAEGILRGVIVTVEPGRVVGQQFVTG